MYNIIYIYVISIIFFPAISSMYGGFVPKFLFFVAHVLRLGAPVSKYHGLGWSPWRPPLDHNRRHGPPRSKASHRHLETWARRCRLGGSERCGARVGPRCASERGGRCQEVVPGGGARSYQGSFTKCEWLDIWDFPQWLWDDGLIMVDSLFS